VDLKSGYPYWAVKNGLMVAFPPLRQDLRCDVAIIGGGLTGSLIANEFSAHGHDVAVLEQRDIGWGSTAASTALLQYEIDTHLTDLIKRHGEADAVRAYRACVDAIGMLQDVARQVRDVGFSRTQSLYFASKRRHRHTLHDEFTTRRRHGIAVEWLEQGAVHARFGIDAPAAILSTVSARVDPYRMTCRLLERLRKRGVVVHDRTTVERIDATARNVTLHTQTGHRIVARHV
jgi:glycine/D-amino acid oxidase-like deaminating enzyme